MFLVSLSAGDTHVAYRTVLVALQWHTVAHVHMMCGTRGEGDMRYISGVSCGKYAGSVRHHCIAVKAVHILLIGMLG